MGVLSGLRVVEIAGLGPAPFCGMLLADMGAEVILVERASAKSGDPTDLGKNAIVNRGKRSLVLDLKDPAAVDALLRLVDGADALIEGMRPGVMERLGLGPDVCLARNLEDGLRLARWLSRDEVADDVEELAPRHLSPAAADGSEPR